MPCGSEFVLSAAIHAKLELVLKWERPASSGRFCRSPMSSGLGSFRQIIGRACVLRGASPMRIPGFVLSVRPSLGTLGVLLHDAMLGFARQIDADVDRPPSCQGEGAPLTAPTPPPTHAPHALAHARWAACG